LLGCSEPVAPSAPALDAGVATFACHEPAAAAPQGLRRLTMTQYRNTVRDLTRWALGDPLDAEIVVSLAGLDALPTDRREPTPDDPHGGYRRLDQALEQTHVDETFHVASALGRALSMPERLTTIAGACAVDGDTANDEACSTDFVRRFGGRALRRPLDADDERFYRVVFGGDPSAGAAAYGDVITVLLSSPEFLYFVEHGASEVAGRPGRYQLTAYELAARLSYHFWQTLPDEQLARAADDGSLLDPAVLDREIDRLLTDPRARETMAELFNDWLGLDRVPALHPHARSEALDLLAYYTWTDPAGIEALLTSERSFTESTELANAYAAEPRAGLLTRAWFLASGGPITRPIQRGVFIRRKLLCDDIAPPPANVSALLPAAREGKTTRQATEELTEQPGTACASCHASAINPLGFAFEGFDARGRTRVDEAGVAIDTSTVPQVTRGDTRSASGPHELVELMLASGKVEACLARNYFRFTFGRLEQLDSDGCALERLRARLADSGLIRDMLEEAALLPEMRERSVVP
jgi:hypothetical protein